MGDERKHLTSIWFTRVRHTSNPFGASTTHLTIEDAVEFIQKEAKTMIIPICPFDGNIGNYRVTLSKIQ